MDIGLAQKLFLEEAEELLDEMVHSLQTLKDSPEQATSEIHQLFRNVHTIKGSCSALGHKNMAEFADTYETFLQFLRQSTQPLQATHHALLSDLHSHLERLLKQMAYPQLTIDLAYQQTLQERIEQIKTHPTPEASTPTATVLSMTADETGNADAATQESNPAFASKVRLDSQVIETLQEQVTSVHLMFDRHRHAIRLKDHALIEHTLEQLENRIDHLQYQTDQLNLVSINALFSRLKMTVEDASQTLGKSITFQPYSSTEFIDRSLAEKLYEPLMHLIRNAVDHGIESIEQRQAQQKPEIATIQCNITQQLGQLKIEIADDGPGLDLPKIREKALQLNLINDTDKLTNTQIQKLIFLPGFTTYDKSNQVSGRGVGLDYVRNYLLQLRGNIQLHTTDGQGTQFILTLPVQSSEQSSLLFRVRNTVFGIDTQWVEECFLLPDEVSNDNFSFLPIAHKHPKIINLKHLFHFAEKTLSYRPKTPTTLMVRFEDDVFAILVDEVLHTCVLRIQPRASFIGSHNYFNGTSLLENGEIAYSLDMFSIREKIHGI